MQRTPKSVTPFACAKAAPLSGAADLRRQTAKEQTTHMKGLFHLQTAKDMLAKLQHDFERLRADPVDAYAAFDFFVTARHLPEWLHPGNPAKQKALFGNNVLLQVCRHIADGSKHFQATASHHTSVKDTSLEGSAFQPGAFQSDAFQGRQLIVHLDGPSATQFGATIEVAELAEQVLRFWQAHPDLV